MNRIEYTVKQLNEMRNNNDPFWVPIVCTDEEMQAAYAKVHSPGFNGDLTEYRKTLCGSRWREVHSR
jgi:hypothetical protein